MKFARRAAVLFTTTAAALGLVGLTSPPASADSYSCDSGEYCVYEDAGLDRFDGILSMASKLDNYANWYYYFSGGRVDNSVTSWENNGINSGPTVIYSYHENNGGGGELWRGGLGAYQSNVGVSRNDYASSHYWHYS